MSINTSNAGRPRWRNPQMLVMLITGGPRLDQRRSVMIRMISDDLKWVWVFPDLGRGRGWAYRSVDEAEIEDSSTTVQCCAKTEPDDLECRTSIWKKKVPQTDLSKDQVVISGRSSKVRPPGQNLMRSGWRSTNLDGCDEIYLTKIARGRSGWKQPQKVL